MRKITVQVFAADPLSAGVDVTHRRLMLDEEVRRMRNTVRAADFREAVEFDVRWATRPGDLLQAMNEVAAEVVHFSGHGGENGLVLVAEDRQPRPVDGAALARLFAAFPAAVRVVVLNACLSLPQARAIARVVGCAIGTGGRISDDAAVTFAGGFYRAIAFGHSVAVAFEQACAELDLAHPGESGAPQLVSRPGVDPHQIVLVPRVSPAPPAAGAAPVEAGASPAPPHPRRPGRRVAASLLVRASTVLLLGAGTVAYVLAAGEQRPGPAAASAAPLRAGMQRKPEPAAPRTPAPARQPDSVPPARTAAKPSGAVREGVPTRRAPAEDDGGGRPQPAPRRTPPRDPAPGGLAFASVAVTEARSEFARGDYLAARRRLAATTVRLDFLERQYPDSEPVRSLQKQAAALLVDVQTACEADAHIRNVEAQCT